MVTESSLVVTRSGWPWWPGGPLRRLAATLAALSAAAAAMWPGVVSADPASVGANTGSSSRAAAGRHGRVFTVWPGADLRAALQQLRPGDTLRLEPGTYRTLAPGHGNPALLRPVLRPGTAGRPITVTAADPSRPPLLLGAVVLDRADHWTVSHLRIQGTVTRQPGLVMNGGHFWVVADTEVFGARDTGALANVAIQGQSSHATVPTGWQFTGNCVHGGGDLASRPGMMHEIYVTTDGRTSGSITGNVLYDTPDGAGVKVGSGGSADAVGASDVTISGNVMVANGRHVLLSGVVSDIRITNNVMIDATYPMSDHHTRPAIYLNRVHGTSSVISDNYVWQATTAIFDLHSAPGSWRNGGGNTVRRVGPLLTGYGCTLRPAR